MLALDDGSTVRADTLLIARDFGPGTLTNSGYPMVVRRMKRGQTLDQAETLFTGQPTDVSVQGSTLRDADGNIQATLITRAEHLDVFHQVFTMFWRDPEYLEKMIRLLSPMIRGETEEKKKKAAERRASEALGDAPKASADAPVRTEVEIDALG